MELSFCELCFVPLAPFGSLWLAWDSLGLPLAVPWVPFAHLGTPVGSRRVSSGLCSHVQRKKADITTPAAQEQASNYSPVSPEDVGEVVSGTAARTPPRHAPGTRVM